MVCLDECGLRTVGILYSNTLGCRHRFNKREWNMQKHSNIKGRRSIKHGFVKNELNRYT